MKVAIVQQKFHGTKEKMLKETIRMVMEAGLGGAELVVLQELHQGRYFCINENSNSFDEANNYKEDLKLWSGVAKESNVVLVTSLFEKRAAGLYHNTSVVFEKDGSIAGKYRKMHIPDDPGFYEKFYFTVGDLGFEPIQTSVGKLGVLICWDQWFPEAARLMALKGAEVLIYPTAIGWFDEDSEAEKQRQLDSWITVQRGHAISNGLSLISVNRVGFENDDLKQISGIRFWGNSFAVGPQGEFLAHATSNKEELIFVDIDLNHSENIRRTWPFLRDRRIESYKGLEKRFID